ncbi:alpha/beta fold hydrolase [Streptomyces lavendulae]|uniref:alpha/beta fold hydrolase n=1 Tax=Streptomyces lavendulae TaxID=1914 RepID=UPI00340ED105
MPTVPVLGSALHHRESGDPDGLPFVFLHGNPTSSHLWRDVLPSVAAPGRRLLAPDLIGMGDSGRPDLACSFDDHARHLDAWFDALGIDEAVLIGHDWGGALAFDRAARLPGTVRGLAFTETIFKPLVGDEFPAAGRQQLARVEHYGSWLASSPHVPKLLAAFEPGPGVMTDRAAVAWCEENIAGLEVSHHGLAGHHSPEDRPGELAAAISSWADRHGPARPGRRA